MVTHVSWIFSAITLAFHTFRKNRSLDMPYPGKVFCDGHCVLFLSVYVKIFKPFLEICRACAFPVLGARF
jgi:hypothetical protein